MDKKISKKGYVVAFKKKGEKNWRGAFAPKKGIWTKEEAHESLLFHKKHAGKERKDWILRVIKR